MKLNKSLLPIIFFFLTILKLDAQEENNWSSRHGFIFQFSSSADIPLLDMGDRFGPFYTLGGGLLYKSKTNQYLQVFFEGLISNRVRQDDIFRNIGYYNSQGYYQLYDINGDLLNPQIMLRGMNIGIGAGKTFPLKSSQSIDNGLQLLTSISFLQHRINHFDRDQVLPQALGQYAEGYDYLTNGLCINQDINYIHFSRNSPVNYSFGFVMRLGLTKNRRLWNFDSGPASDKLRKDLMLGVKFRWYIPLFKKLDKEIYF